MRRFFYDPNQQDDPERVVLAGAEAYHLNAVLRMRSGDTAELFDGAGGIALGQLEAVRGSQAVFHVLSRRVEPEYGPPLTLALAFLKGQKMELALQKAAELGVHTFLPVISRYCERQTWSEQLFQRWQRIVLESCKQCGRPVPLRIVPPAALHALSLPAESLRLMPWEQEDSSPLFSAAAACNNRPIVLLIGPEGGFHPEDVAQASEAGFQTVSLGPRILRAETAAIAAVVLVQQATRALDRFPPPGSFLIHDPA